MSLLAQDNEALQAPGSPNSHRKRPRVDSPQKLRQVLDYTPSVDKVSDLLGVDAPKVYEIYREQAEGQLERQKLYNTPRNKRNSQKALSLLGHDPSAEKVKRTLGIDDESIETVQRQNTLRNTRPRRSETNLHKTKYAKALSTLGFDVSLYKATQLLGVDEEILRAVVRLHAERTEEQDTERRVLQEQQALRDKKNNQKALTVIGYDPSLEKALSMLGVGEGSPEEAQVGSILPVDKRQRGGIPSFPQATALVYALSIAILFVALRQSYT